jgi:type III restriction enzyme
MRLDRLQYQLDAIDKVIGAINGENVSPTENFNANPLLRNTQHIDVKMETGTGKTYVYTRLMHELKQQFGFFKFIIIVPSLAIKEGIKMSIQSDDWVKHFRQEFNNQNIHLGVVNAGDFDVKKGKRKQIPEAIRSYCDGSQSEEKAIQLLLLNDAMLASKSMTDDKYDSTLFGSVSCPIEGLKQTRPIVIIDEPHRFKKENQAWKNIVERLYPQLIIRFGATFPERIIGKGKLKKTEKDYEHLVYDLNSVRAFNEGLVKGVHVMYPALSNPDSAKYKVTKIEKGKSATFNGKLLREGDSLSLLDNDFANITLEYAPDSPTKLQLSNSLTVDIGLTLTAELYGSSYQELMLSQALEAHFDIERKNFYRNQGARIKTNSLFFIDSIASFRGNSEAKGWLRVKFEELLTKQIEKELKTANGEYRDYLTASLERNEKGEMVALAGYFAEDNARQSNTEIQKEVDAILRDKEQSLTFKNKTGQWNVRRFFFSKWTLCEGWDNPNVFVITKLRSSGSEIRKLQEVGRGLRLPFDEHGVRINDEEFYLTYIIDYSERSFAKKLVEEINTDGGTVESGKITDNILASLVKNGYAVSVAKAKGKLLLDDIIDETDSITKLEELFALLPEGYGLKVKAGKITGDDLPKKPVVHLNKKNFEKLRELWNELRKRYMLRFEAIADKDLHDILIKAFSDERVFVSPTVEIVEEFLTKESEHIGLAKAGYRSADSIISVIPYGDFLKRINKQTALPIPLLHACIVEVRKGKDTPNELFNRISLKRAITEFHKKFVEWFTSQKFTYSHLNYTASTNLFTADNEFVDTLPQGLLGDKEATDILHKNDNYLYDKYVYDSEIEHQVLQVKPPIEVIAYGKLPRLSIKLPTYTGGTTSPDFVYAIRNPQNGATTLYLIVETKSDNPRLSDTIAIEAQRKAFKDIAGIEWRMKTNVEEFEEELRKIAAH